MANTGKADYGELLKYLLGTMGAQVGSGIKGLSVLPKGPDAAADAVHAYQQKYSPSDDLTTDGVRAVQNTIVPAANVAHTLYGPQTILGSAGRSLMDKWQAMKDKAAEHSPLDATAMEVLPAIMNPELGLGSKTAGEVAGAVRPFARGNVPLLDDGATEATLLRERAANTRRTQDGLGQGDVPVSEFPGRSAEHEGAVAQRMMEDGAPLDAPPDAMAPAEYTNWIGRQGGEAYAKGGGVLATAAELAAKYSRHTGDEVAQHLWDTQIPGIKKNWTLKDGHNLAGLDSGGDYGLLQYPLDMIHADQPISDGVIKRYAAQPTPFPPIVMDSDGGIRDGNHRIAAARARGDTHIAAYVPIDTTTNDLAAGASPFRDGAPLPGEDGYAKGGLAQQYSIPDHAGHLAQQLATNGKVTYSPSSGNIHAGGFLVPMRNRTAALDHPPTDSDVHDFLMQHEDAFQHPSAVLHAESTPAGHFLHVAAHANSPEEAATIAHETGAPGFHSLDGGSNHVELPLDADNLT